MIAYRYKRTRPDEDFNLIARHICIFLIENFTIICNIIYLMLIKKIIK